MAGLQTGDVPSRPEQPRPEPGQILIVIRTSPAAESCLLLRLFGALEPPTLWWCRAMLEQNTRLTKSW